jgi:hypothetical protein
MSPEQRDAAMDELERLDREIRNMLEDIDDDDPDHLWQVHLRYDLYHAQWEREKLLQTFPEVRHWPKEEPCRA